MWQLLTASLFLLSVSPAYAQMPASADRVSKNTINAKIGEIATDTDLDEATRTKLNNLYQKALGFLEIAQSSEAASKSFREARQSADAEVQAIRDKNNIVAQTPATAELKVSEHSPVADIEQSLLKQQADRAAVAAKLSDLNALLAMESGRPAAVRDEIGQLTRRQDALEMKAVDAAQEGESALLIEARNWVSKSEGMAIASQLQMLDQELLSQPMRVALLRANVDKESLSLNRIDSRILLLEQMLNIKRTSEAETAKRETFQAAQEAKGKHPLVQRIAEQNVLLSEELSGLANKLEQVRADEAEAVKDAGRIKKDFSSTRLKLELAGINQVLGLALLEQRRALPDVREIDRNASAIEKTMVNAGLQLIQEEDERQQLQDLVEYMNNLTEKLPFDQKVAIHNELQALAEARRDLLDKTLAMRQTLVRALSELDVAQRQLLDVVSGYNAFLAERLLWIRSAPAPSLKMLLLLPEQFMLVLSLESWKGVFSVLFADSETFSITMICLFVVGALLWKRKTWSASLLATGKKIKKIRTDSFAFTFQALILTLLLAAPWPLLSLSIGLLLAHSAEVSEFSRPVSRALIWVANTGFFLTSFYVLCAPGGLAAAHFHWSEQSLQRLRRGLTRLKFILLPAGFLTLVLFSYDLPKMGGGLARLTLSIALISLAVFFYRLFDLRNGVLRAYMDSNPKKLLSRLRYVWLIITVANPLVLAGMAMIGYLYTAGVLTESLISTLWLFLTLLTVQQLVIRWLLLTRRKLAFQAAIERREAARLKDESESTKPSGIEAFSDQVEEPEIDLDALSEDSLKLLNMILSIIAIMAVWVIWSKVLPAFGILKDVTLWYSTDIVAGQGQQVPITLANVGLSVVIAIITVLSTKRFPALLEIGLLQRLKMSPGGRYAATTLSIYAIAAIGTLLALGNIGAHWSQIQWLVAALSVGIGFGLQEIVANFISGIIILFERPIRVGDTVTVGDTDGIVTRIQIRATTIRNWDGKELLVPNKEFITARLLNWTLSDQLTRIVIPVGLAYGSDVEKAMSLLIEASHEHPLVLDEPEPSVVFDAFADNALSLKLRCFVENMDYRIATVSDLHKIINKKFNAAGLVFAFPQRDVHLDSSRPLEIRVLRDNPEPGV